MEIKTRLELWKEYNIHSDKDWNSYNNIKWVRVDDVVNLIKNSRASHRTKNVLLRLLDNRDENNVCLKHNKIFCKCIEDELSQSNLNREQSQDKASLLRSDKLSNPKLSTLKSSTQSLNAFGQDTLKKDKRINDDKSTIYCPYCNKIIYNGETIVWINNGNEIAHSGCVSGKITKIFEEMIIMKRFELITRIGLVVIIIICAILIVN